MLQNNIQYFFFPEQIRPFERNIDSMADVYSKTPWYK